MSYQNINQYNFPKWYLKLVYGENDICLSSDEVDFNQEVVFSPYLIAQTDGKRLPIYFDLNNFESSQKLNLEYKNYNPNNVLISLNYLPTDKDIICYTSNTSCDIGLVGTDNGLVSQMTGETITFTNGLLDDSQKFDRYHFDRRLKLFQVTSYANSPNERFPTNEKTLYEVVSKTDYTGYYNELYGGFYQGFFKLFGYDYETFPSRMNKGWSVEMVLKPRLVNEYFPSTDETTLNDVYPDNKNTFFYFGTRAENKYYHIATGSTSGYTRVTSPLSNCLYTCKCADTGVTNSRCFLVYPITATSEYHYQNCGCGCVDKISDPSEETDPKYDSMSNALSIKFSGDPRNPKLCIRTLTMTGGCETTGFCESGLTYVTGYTINEYCTDKSIYDYCKDTNYIDSEHWVLIDVIWERNTWLDDCDLQYRGGTALITEREYVLSLEQQTVQLIEPPITHDNIVPEQIDIISLNERWLQEKKYRLGKLKVYVNGRLFQVFENVEEIIPRALNTEKEKQVGVPFNISWGGGTQGLRENLIFSACPITLTNFYIQDPECLPNNTLSGSTLSGLTTNILLERIFGGTFDGGISQFRMYTQPLGSDEIKHNFKILKNMFRLFDIDCPDCTSVTTTTTTINS